MDPRPPSCNVRVDAGYGHGVIDVLRARWADDAYFTVYEVHAAGTPEDPDHYNNRRSELWFYAAERGREGRLDLSLLEQRDYDALAGQLATVPWKPQGDKRIVEDKEKMRARLGRSPDDADAFNLAYMGSAGSITLAGVEQH